MTGGSTQKQQVPKEWGERLIIPEWEDQFYRKDKGWVGRDLVHDPDAPVRIKHYYVNYGPGGGGIGTTLTGICFFSQAAESHQGYCHGGSFCSLMDDVVGWVSFCVTGKIQPWTGLYGPSQYETPKARES